MKIDSKIYRFMELVYKGMQLNFLFLIGCIFGISVGPSITATFSVITKFVNKEDDFSLFREFLKSYKKNFLKSELIYFFYIILFLLLSYNVELISNSKYFILLNYVLRVHITAVFLMAKCGPVTRSSFSKKVKPTETSLLRT